MKRVIGLVGESGSGKDTFCNILEEAFSDVVNLRFSDPLVQALRMFVDDVGREDLQWLANNLRERFGENVLAKALEKKVASIDEGFIILNGVRVWDDYRLIRKNEWQLIYITAPAKLRWQRVKKRGEKVDDNAPFDEFLEKEKKPTEIEIPSIGKRADIVIENTESIQDFKEKIITIFK